jgi:hypothetical protein
MAVRARAFFPAIALAIVTAFALTIHAIAQWASTEGLGDVAVSFDNEILVFNDSDLYGQQVDTVTVSGIDGGLEFDAALNLLVTNTAFGGGSGSLWRLPAASPHTSSNPIQTTSAGLQAIAIAADGTIYAASPGAPVTVWRFPTVGSPTSFTVTTDSDDCVGIDLAPDGNTLYLASGGRNIYTIPLGSNSPSATVWTTLSGGGSACGLRLLAPIDIRAGGTSEIHGGLVVADGGNVKRLSVAKQVVDTFDAGTGKKNWIDVALDPDLADFFAVDAGSWRLAKFRMSGTPKVQALRDLAAQPHGVAVNGELRAALTVRLTQLLTPVTETSGTQTINLYQGTVTFLEGLPQWQTTWLGRSQTQMSFAIQAYEVRDAPTPTPPAPTTCVPSLDIDCKLQNFRFAVPKAYYHGRPVVYREIVRSTGTLYRMAITYPNETYTTGEECTVGGTPRGTTALLRAPWPDNLFTKDVSFILFGGDDGLYGRSTGSNDSIVVNRGDARYFLRITRLDSTVQLGRSEPVSVEVRDPTTNCSLVPGLENTLQLSITDISGPGIGTPVGDGAGVTAVLGSNGITWSTLAGVYRTVGEISRTQFSSTPAPSKYRLCVSAPGNAPTDPPIAPQACGDFTVK